jgi:hypothetical protein
VTPIACRIYHSFCSVGLAPAAELASKAEVMQQWGIGTNAGGYLQLTA